MDEKVEGECDFCGGRFQPQGQHTWAFQESL